MSVKKNLYFWVGCLLGIASCNGGIETFTITNTPTEVHAPSIEDIRAALQAANPTGMQVGKALNEITLPPFRGQSNGIIQSFTCYSMTDLPSWLEFDSANHSLRLATGQTGVSTEANTAITVTYTCDFGGSLADSISFVINDMDGGGLVDQVEANNATAPLVGKFGTVSLDAATMAAYLIGVEGVAPFPNGLTVTQQGFDPSNPDDDVEDFDGDGLSNAEEIAGAGNMFIRASNADFSNSSLIANGNYISVMSADWNSDGNLDLAAINFATEQVDVFFGAGDGSFALDHSYNTPSAPSYIESADVDADGKLDLLVSSKGVGDQACLSLFRGNGDGTFAPNEIIVSKVNRGVDVYFALADFDGDGNYDIVDSLIDEGILEIRLGNGDGSFTLTQSYVTGSFPVLPGIADLNHDGWVDIFTPNVNDPALHLLFGDNTVSFSTQSAVPASAATTYVSVGDMNNDGHLDLLANNALEAILLPRFGNGNGLFSIQDNIAVDADTDIPILADFNGDGSLDIMISEGGDDQIELLIGDGVGGFANSTVYATADEPSFTLPCDFDNDGDIDIVVLYDDGDELRYFENN